MSAACQGRNITFDPVITKSLSHFQLYVGKEDTVKDIQNKFSEIFPHLLISIFNHRAGFEGKLNQDYLYTQETRIKDINPETESDKLDIDSHMTVATFESVFFNKFGLFVQVSRRNRQLDSEKYRIDQFTLDEVNSTHQEEIFPGGITFFRDVPFGC
jgi:hypothetical protein